ncbi:SWIB/MDM2 domain-containing protein [Melaminivora sp.]
MATAKKTPAAPAAPAAAPTEAKKRTPNAAFMKPLTPSPALAAVVGKAPLPRTEIISKLWVYIKAHNLQDASNKRMINADAKLKEVFGKPQVSMFEMAGLIGKHVK